jgi:hypothetical protein
MNVNANEYMKINMDGENILTTKIIIGTTTQSFINDFLARNKSFL